MSLIQVVLWFKNLRKRKELFHISLIRLGLMIPVEIDTALEDFFERLLQEYVYFWYSEISYDEDFVQEIRYEIK